MAEWPGCPKCGATARQYLLKNTGTGETGARPSLRKCSVRGNQYVVRLEAIFEDSNIPLSKWRRAIHLMRSSDKDGSMNQRNRTLGISYKACWFLCRRPDETIKLKPLRRLFGSGEQAVSDKTNIGKTEDQQTEKTG